VHFNVTEARFWASSVPTAPARQTLFGMLSGHVQPSAGKVVFRGEDITRLVTHDRARRGIARTFQGAVPVRADERDGQPARGRHVCRRPAWSRQRDWIERVLAITGLVTACRSPRQGACRCWCASATSWPAALQPQATADR
jgi:branched-chain amino acid transport system ATP-binding protein